MPTGYTSIIESDPNCTFARYAWRCARAMGAFMMQRDDGLDAKVVLQQEPETYYEEGLREAEAALAEHDAASEDVLRARYAEEWLLAEDAHQTALAAYLATRAQYERMEAQVQAWVPPSPDHEGLKKFMLDQLVESQKWSSEPTAPVAAPYLAWRDARRAHLERNVSYYTEHVAKEAANCVGRNAWVAALVASLGTPPQNDERLTPVSEVTPADELRASAMDLAGSAGAAVADPTTDGAA